MTEERIQQLVEVSGRNLYLECTGTGTPTVVLLSGFGHATDIWSVTDTAAPAVFPALAETNRVCAWDRPGSMIMTTMASGTLTIGDPPYRPGRSGSAPMPRDPAEVVTELHDLLAAAGVPGPYVLVGHSLGGVLGVLYARTYPDEVAGLVVIDSPLPPQRDALVAEFGAEVWEQSRMQRPPDPTAVPGYQIESYDIGTLFDEIEAAGPLPDIPVVVVRRGGPAMSDDAPPEQLPFTTKQWESQVKWAAGVPGAEVITVPNTTHYVPTQRPDAVVDAIREAIARG